MVKKEVVAHLFTICVTRKPALANPIDTSAVYKWVYDRNQMSVTGTTYIGNMEYNTTQTSATARSCNLLRVHNEEGYADNINSSYVSTNYYYLRRDHLGNTREVWRAPYTIFVANNIINPAGVVQRTQYYASGLPWAVGEGASTQPYKYNGKEFVEMHGYDTYDYGARGYYAAIMRFSTVDPACELYYSFSTYQYVRNNPINRIDPNGMFDYGYTIDDEGRIKKVDNTGVDENGKNQFDVLYTKKEYEEAKASGEKNEYGFPKPKNQVTITDTNILPQLENYTNTFKYKIGDSKYTNNVANTDNRHDAYKLFKFAAENTKVEWNYQRYTDGKLSLATANENSTVASGHGHSSNTDRVVAVDIHSHPGSTYDDLKGSGTDYYIAKQLELINKEVKVQLYMPKAPNPTARWLDLVNNKWINY